MSAFQPEKPGSPAPPAGPRADMGTDMTNASRGPRFGPEDLQDPERAQQALLHWDALDARLLAVLERHPHHGPKLATLRAAEAWLSEQAEPRTPPGSCPSADELYDYGRGPGFRQLDPARRTTLEAHVRSCEDCQELVLTLAAPPPLPLEFDDAPLRALSDELPPLTVEIPSVTVRPGPQARPRSLRPLRQWLPMAAAAGFLLLAGGWFALRQDGAALTGPRPDPLLRGRSSEVLWFPRGALLASDSLLHTGWPALAPQALFELAPQAGAEEYKVELFHAGGDAFTRGGRIWSASSTQPTLELPLGLEPGRYTYEAWVVVRGLEQPLGARDFSVVRDAGLEQELASLGRLEDVLRLLDQRGYVSDARALAHRLPEGELRSAWLSPIPGR